MQAEWHRHRRHMGPHTVLNDHLWTVAASKNLLLGHMLCSHAVNRCWGGIFRLLISEIQSFSLHFTESAPNALTSMSDSVLGTLSAVTKFHELTKSCKSDHISKCRFRIPLLLISESRQVTSWPDFLFFTVTMCCRVNCYVIYTAHSDNLCS